MKSMLKILFRYVLSAAGITLILLSVNFALLAAWTAQSGKAMQSKIIVSQMADSLTWQNGAYAFDQTAQSKIQGNHQWAMLIDNADGSVVWELDCPSDIPRRYSLTDVASFTRWYLYGYPVSVWEHPDGLFVLGSERDSAWKYNVVEPMTVMNSLGFWITGLLVLNGIAAVLLALLSGLRLFRCVKPLALGIEEMAHRHPVELPTRGLLGDLANGINQASARLTRQEAALQQRDSARTVWIAGVSHDIRTPLSIVMGYASQLAEDPELAPAKQRQAGIILRQSERIKTLVNDLNLVSKLSYDMQPLRKTELSLAVLLRGVAADFVNSGLPEGYTFELVIADTARNLRLCADEELIRRAVSNLMANSVQHNPGGCAIKVKLQKEQANAILTVSDNGTGFSQETLEKLNHPQSAAELPSHGLGLAIVRQILKAHGGTVQFHNLPEGGCAAVLCLSAKEGDAL